jgi:hypothetical protein
MAQRRLDGTFLVAAALDRYCGTNDAGSDCIWRTSDISYWPSDDPGYGITFAFKNRDDQTFFLDCRSGRNGLNCDLRVARRYLFGGGAGLFFNCTGDPASGGDVFFDSYPNAAEMDISGPYCLPTTPLWAPKKQEEAEEYEPNLDNFYGSVVIYLDSGISEDERRFVRSSLQAAAKHTAMFTKEYLGLAPLFDRLELFYRPVCDDTLDPNASVSGASTYFGQIKTTPIYCDYKEREADTIFDRDHFRSGLAHEFLHTYFEPILAEDPSRILEEGLTTYLQFNLASETCPGNLQDVADTFPKEPSAPHLVYNDIRPGMTQEMTDADGEPHDISIDGAGEWIAGDIDGIPFFLENGACYLQDEIDGYFVCPSIGDGETALLFFKQAGVIRKTLRDKGFEPAGLYYSQFRLLWGYDETGELKVFKDTAIADYEIEPVFDQSDTKLFNPDHYISAYLMITELEQLFWKHHPGIDPNFVVRAFGEINNEFRERVYDPSYDPSTTNIYHLICDKTDIPETECLDVFKEYGLDPEFRFGKNSILNHCLP